VHELRHKYKVIQLIECAGLARSTYYYYIKTFEKTDKYEGIKTKIRDIYNNNKGRYGYRRITLELRNNGININHKTVRKLMLQLKLKCLVRVKKYKSYRGKTGNVAPNILARNFQADKPNIKWVTDVTEFSLLGQKIYLSTILDLYNGEIISYNITQRPTFDLVTNMLIKAVEKIQIDKELILHSDQGWHYHMKEYQQMLRDNRITQSMSRKGNCLDNSVMENFFGHLKSELLYLQKFNSLEHFINELHEYIYYYNNHRIKAKLKGLSPVDYRNQSLLSA